MKNVRILALLFSVIISINGFSQNWPWARSGNGGGQNDEYGVATDNAGNIYATGLFNGSTITFGTYTLTNAGGNNIFLVKYDPSGNVLWAKGFGGSVDDRGYSVATDTYGHIYLTGFFSSTLTFGTYTLTNSNNTTPYYDIFLAKLDTSGNTIWAKSAGGMYQDWSFSVAPDDSGNVFISGAFDSPVLSIGTFTLSNPGYQSGFIAKYNKSGTVIWAKSFGGLSYNGYGDAGTCLKTDHTGDVYLTGSFSSSTITFGTYTLTNAGSADIFVVKYDPGGSAVFAISVGGTGNDGGFSIAIDAATNMYVTGAFASSPLVMGTYTLTNAGSDDVFIAKFSPSGNIIWAQSAGGTGSDHGYCAATDFSGNIYVTGGFDTTISFGSNHLIATISWLPPLFIVKYNSNGSVLCATALESGGGSYFIGNDGSNGVATDTNGNTYIIGSFKFIIKLILGSDTLFLSGQQSVFTAKFTCGAMGVEYFDNPPFQVFPNPSDGNYTLQIDAENTPILIYNNMGALIYTSKIHSQKSEINLSSSPPGIYFLLVGNQRLKLIKE